MRTVVDRFIKYVSFDTKSNPESTTTPSTPSQLAFGDVLVEELKELGLQDIQKDENGYIYATLPANCESDAPVIAFISHMDTSPDFNADHVKPQIIDYQGGDIILNQEKNIVLSPTDFPSLNQYVGQQLITTDGTTLLGADDKAGIAEIMTAMDYLIQHPEIKHGTVKVAFTPDEEIGRGADHFKVEEFKADFAYTMDGGVLGELQYESFNAAGAKLTIHGKSVHPGDAKNKMINAALIATEIANQFPVNETPQHTEHYEGFYHLIDISGHCEEAVLKYIIRDFDTEQFNARKKFVEQVVQDFNQKYPSHTVELELKDQYYNMNLHIKDKMHIVELAKKALIEVGVEPLIVPVRGGTDGSKLSFMGLPTPNLFTGGHNFHGKFEYIPIPSMEKGVEVIVKIAELAAK
ncbi:peptidase T [Turicibacter sanguinis]|nr:peptidase T [Turicibacter sanguinis]MDB8551235.1 peptidase T [Turicibacter sanguinis]